MTAGRLQRPAVSHSLNVNGENMRNRNEVGERREAPLRTPSSLGAEDVRNITAKLNGLLADVFAVWRAKHDRTTELALSGPGASNSDLAGDGSYRYAVPFRLEKLLAFQIGVVILATRNLIFNNDRDRRLLPRPVPKSIVFYSSADNQIQATLPSRMPNPAVLRSWLKSPA